MYLNLELYSVSNDYSVQLKKYQTLRGSARLVSFCISENLWLRFYTQTSLKMASIARLVLSIKTSGACL